MSSHLLMLLERIKPKHEKPKPVDKPPESPYLNALMLRIRNKELLEAAKEDTLIMIRHIKGMLRLINHIFKCGNCMFELILDVERYLGTHGPFGVLDLNNNEYYEELAGMADEELDAFGDFRLSHELKQLLGEFPLLENYDLGNYWTGSTSDTKRFIEDRLKWLRKVLIVELKQARQHYRMLLSWDIRTEDTPIPYTPIIL